MVGETTSGRKGGIVRGEIGFWNRTMNKKGNHQAAEEKKKGNFRILGYHMRWILEFLPSSDNVIFFLELSFFPIKVNP